MNLNLVTRIDFDAQSDEGIWRLVEALRIVVPHRSEKS
mgnify:CR=1 FL=1